MQQLEDLWRRGQDFLGCRIPIMAGAMSYISESNLVAAISNIGAFGVLASSAMQGSDLLAEIKATKAKTNKPFGVNLILLNPYINELVEACIEEEIKYVVLAGGIPSKSIVQQLKTSGSKVLAFAPGLNIAQKMVQDYQIDGLILEGSEAGGHIGSLSTTILVQEILPFIKEVPVFVGGGIARGETIANYLKLGAAGVQIGTLFAAATESIAHPNFKQAFIAAKSRNAQASVQISPDFNVIPVRALQNKGTLEFLQLQERIVNEYKAGKINKADATLKIERYWAGALKRAVIEGDVEYGSLMAGQAVGSVVAVKPVKEIIQLLINEAKNYLI